MDHATSLPIREIVFYRSGIGHVTHEGSVTGDETVRLAVAPDAIDDLLQSIVVDDPGGRAPQVGFAAADPEGRVLATYALDLSSAHSLVALLRQARGEQVVVRASDRVEGRLVAVDLTDDPRGPERTHLTLNTADGLRRIELGEVRSLRFVDPGVQADLDAALATLASHRATDEREVELRFRGSGERTVTVAYVRPMPVWKTAYRLALGEGPRADLQGWAIVDNPTGVDLEDVAVSVVAGDPMSFVVNLADPRHVERPRIDPKVTESVVPESYAMPAADLAMPAFAPRAAAPAAGAPRLAARRSAYAGSVVEPEAAASTVGIDVAYALTEPVTIARHSSTMVPILQQDLPAERMSVFDPDVDGGHPMRGLRLRNATELSFAAGPVTVLDGAYAGTASLDDLLPGGEQLVTHARDLAVTVEVETGEPRRTTRRSLVNGLVRSSTTTRIPTTVTLRSTAATDRLVLVVLPTVAGFEAVASPPTEVVGDQVRLRALLAGRSPGTGDDPGDGPLHGRSEAPGAPCRVELEMRRVEHSDAYAHLADDIALAACLNAELTADQRAALEQVAALGRERADVERESAVADARRQRIEADQERIRGNLGSLDHGAQLYQRYLGELGRQEDELAALRERQDALTARRDELWRRARELGESLAER